jgi:predicted RNA binding protein YcfA (HicA-like mRNA interferase family)
LRLSAAKALQTTRQTRLEIDMVVTITTMRSADIIKKLESDGWTLRGVRGSHHVFKHPTKPGHISVPHPKKDLGIGLVQKLFKQAGLK